MRARALSVALLTLLAGCVGGTGPNEAGADDSLRKARVDLGDHSGAVEGIVTDAAVQPIAAARLLVVGLEGLETRTAADGQYVMEPVPPGTYTIEIAADGFVPAVLPVEVVAGQTTTLDAVLVNLLSDQPYVEVFEHIGYFEYSWGLGHNATGDEFYVLDNNCDYDQVAGQGCRGEFELDAPLESVVFEQVWEPYTPLATRMHVLLRASDNAAIVTSGTAILDVWGASPIQARLDRADLDTVLDRFREACEDGQDEFCGMNYRDTGWPLQTRVWLDYRCLAEEAGFCAAIEQDYTQYLTAFYNAPAPAGYSILSAAGGANRRAATADAVVAPPGLAWPGVAAPTV